MKPVLFFALFVITFASCRKDRQDRQENTSDPRLIQAIIRDTSGHVTRSSRYNQSELLVSDSLYNVNGSVNGFIINQYNSSGKLLRSELTAPAAYAGGYLWADENDYVNGTLLVSNRHYLRGNQTSFTRYFYNGNGWLVTDSVLHTSFTQGNSVKVRTYDPQGRILTELTTNTNGDTSRYLSYTYSGNQTELITSTYSYLPAQFVSTSRIITVYNTTGLIISETSYDASNQVSQQITNTYNNGGQLLLKITTSSSGTFENRYVLNPATGRWNYMDYYFNGVRYSTTTYYYE